MTSLEKLRSKSLRWYYRNRDNQLEKMRAWHKRNPEKSKKNKKRWRSENPEKVKEARRRYYFKHRDRIRLVNDAWAKSNPESIKRHKEKWRLNNPDKVLEIAKRNQSVARSKNPELFRKRNREDYRKHREKRIITARKWAKNNPSKRSDYEHKRRTVVENGEDCSNKIDLLTRERFCHWCCIPLTEFNRTIDHVIPVSRGGEHKPDNLVAACKSCNCSKNDKLVSEWIWRAA